jgi:hypothetical protein
VIIMNLIEDKKKTVEFRKVVDEELPPIIITMNEDDEPKMVLNMYHRIWISLHRKTIAGIINVFPEKIDEILDDFLGEQRANEKMDWD